MRNSFTVQPCAEPGCPNEAGEAVGTMRYCYDHEYKENMPKLKSETNTPQMEKRIGDAFDAKFPHLKGDCNVDFEHCQWWVTHIFSGAQWSVVDAEGPGSVDGFDFEQVSEGDDQ